MLRTPQKAKGPTDPYQDTLCRGCMRSGPTLNAYGHSTACPYPLAWGFGVERLLFGYPVPRHLWAKEPA